MLFLCSKRDVFANFGEHLRGDVHRPFLPGSTFLLSVAPPHVMETSPPPSRQADDALLLDNSHMTIPEQQQWLLEQYKKVVG